MRGVRFHNGRIYTLDRADTVARALACWQGRIVAVGTDAEVRDRFAGFTEVDLEGLVVLPAFTDAHLHLVALGLSRRRVNLEGAGSLREAVLRVAEAVRRATPGSWILGRGWEPSRWPEGRLPSREDLDAVSPENPVALWSRDGHLLWCNSLALAQAGVGPGTPSPPGGVIEREGERPTGVLREAATALVARAVPPPPDGEVESAILEAVRDLHRRGITGVHEMAGPAEDRSALAVLQRMHQAGTLRIRVAMAIPVQRLEEARRLGLRSGLGDEWLRVGFVKVFADGTLGSQTAAMLEPYEGQPQNSGVAAYEREELVDLVTRAARAGWSCAVHAIGDRANRWALDAFEAAQEVSRRGGLRHRVEHAQLVHPADLPRFGRLRVVASMQPLHCASDEALARQYWGARSRYAYAWRSLLRSGAVLAFGSDAPVESPDVLRSLYVAVFRRHPAGGQDLPGPEETLSVREALRAYTLGPAYAAGEEHLKGSLEVGKVCDLVALDQDILQTPEALPETRVRMTVLGGEVVFSD
ncbi:MAG: amidohydrolase [Armatimonadota bacterium]|nr:amidohydrolase [Armatimonadota bacterium]MDR7440275.1 amidohydrolase [Armatimonadota bacterium]MDR7563932.1 amidohydrolase [Armatimonadota bacterium]MDR7568176.1 amidohydrolase [Armatimonadota bacterium]MDR7602714.1 amidohydrolase [Armatimonadota bacterium]